MKSETPVDKIARVHASIKQNKSYKIVRWIHAVVAYASLVVVMATGGLFLYESVGADDEYVRIEAVVSTKAEYEDGGLVSFYPIVDMSYSQPVEMTTTLRCDSHDGKGIHYIGTDTTVMKSKYHSSDQDILTYTKVFLDSVGEAASFKVRAAGIRQIVDGKQIPIPYNGPLPTAIVSTCYAEHSLQTTSPIFKIPNKQTVLSFPFEYVWYDYFDDGNR